ncbi:MAG: DUF4340 domain-containing protein [Acutalibacteraceae bacterium]
MRPLPSAESRASSSPARTAIPSPTQEYTDDNSYTACVEDYYYKTDGDTLLPLDSDLVEDYLRGIAGLSLTNYVTYNAGTEDLSGYGLDNPELTITVRYTDGTEDAEEETFTLNISRSPEEKAAAESDTEEEDEEITAYARVGESEIVYQLTQSEYESLMAAATTICAMTRPLQPALTGSPRWTSPWRAPITPSPPKETMRNAPSIMARRKWISATCALPWQMPLPPNSPAKLPPRRRRSA